MNYCSLGEQEAVLDTWREEVMGWGSRKWYGKGLIIIAACVHCPTWRAFQCTRYVLFGRIFDVRNCILFV